MSINKSELSLEDKLVKDIEDIKEQLLTLKTSSQPIGADMLAVEQSGAGSVGPLNLAAGGATSISYSVQPLSNFVKTLFNFEVTLYVDGNTTAYQYPNGSALTAGQRLLKFENWMDYADGTGNFTGFFQRVFKARVMNQDTVAHDYHFTVVALYPKFTVV